MTKPKATMLSLDLEMTGLDPTRDVILEIGGVAVDDNLQEVSRFEAVASYPHIALRNMNPLVTEMHTGNGLIEAVGKSRQSLDMVAFDFMEWMLEHFGLAAEQGAVRLLGDCVHLDWEFLRHRLPVVFSALNYEHRDIGSAYAFLKGLGFEPPADPGPPEGMKRHRALPDALGAVEWAKLMLQWMNHNAPPMPGGAAKEHFALACEEECGRGNL